MFQLYKEKVANPVGIHIYRSIFNSEFNLSFFKPKKDQCDKCLLFRNKKDATPLEKLEFENHRAEKLALKVERDIDRSNIDPFHCVICYDLQSVFSLPKGNASSFYYKRKINVYNLTASVIIPQKTKITYCAIWSEAHSGRSGNDISSALLKILRNIVVDNPHIKRITMWSDSCVPQNKNKINTTAIKQFLHDNKEIEQVHQKFSEPGHSLVQEVDCVHSTIDRFLKNVEICSPLHLIKLLKNINGPKVHLKILQMRAEDFISFSRKSEQLDFQKVPFSKIKIIEYNKNDQFSIKYKTSARELEFKTISIIRKPTKKTLKTPNNLFDQKLLPVSNRPSISKEKKDDIKSLLPFLPQEDINYFKALIKV